MVKNTVVLGAGPAGLWTALSLLRSHPGIKVTVFEKSGFPGGIASSFRREGLTWDMGSHRFHPSSSPEVFSSVRELLGETLLRRRRNGRIRLEERFLKFPLRPADMLLHLPPSFIAGAVMDTLRSPFRKGIPQNGSFEETLIAGLGNTIPRRFYFPYAEKLWGLKPDELDGEQARKRVSASRLSDMIRKAAGVRYPGSNSSCFYYPRGGFGMIFRKAVARIRELGGEVVFGAEVKELHPMSGLVKTLKGEIQSDFTFSTLPITKLAALLSPSPPRDVSSAANELAYRSMILCFIKFPVDRLTEYDAHYFPNRETTFSRISERKNYDDMDEAPGFTGICAEIPCWKTDDVWRMGDGELVATVLTELKRSGLKVPDPVCGFAGRVSCAYPSYPLGWETPFGILDSWLREIPGLVSLGRQGRYAHDNTHHSMEMGMAAAGCLENACRWNGEKWKIARQSFRRHVVED